MVLRWCASALWPQKKLPTDYRTTLAHYTVLGLADVTKAINTLPQIEVGEVGVKMAATDTDGRAAPDTVRRSQNPTISRAKMHPDASAENKKPAVGFEPTTTRLQARNSSCK